MQTQILQRRAAAALPSTVPKSAAMFNLFKFGKKRSHQYVAASAPAQSTSTELIEKTSQPTVASGSIDHQDLYSGSTTLPPGKQLKLQLAVCYLPHPEKVHYGGEDAHFISDYGGGMMGVADGVGGWQESGVNPADYSRTLMLMSRAYLEGNDIFQEQAASRSGVLIDPRGALEAAHMNTKVPGSATACVMQLDQANGVLAAANLGDSGFMVVREGKELIRSKPLQHYFDCPLQFGAFPEFVEATDTADMADLYSITLRPGDVIVAGTDGLWDNCYISEIIAMSPRSPTDAQSSADAIAATARRHASDTEFASPYTREALSQGLDLPWWDKLLGMSFKGGKLHLKQLTGGKMDDITVLVAFVEATDIPPPPSPPSAEAQMDGGAADAASGAPAPAAAQ